ncbi:unnamed protein product [Wickerhamomyces anomalus]
MTISKTLLAPNFEEQKSQPHTFYLFGEHLSKSKAPFLHNALFKSLGYDEWDYKIYETSYISEISHKINSEKLFGSAVTMPNKVKAVELVDLLDDIGKGCGSINTIYTRTDPNNGRALKIGTNTDTVVYGGGGACRSAIFALYKLLNVPKVYIINRYESEVEEVKVSMKLNGFEGEIIHVKTAEQAREMDPPKLVVLTVPNFEPQTTEEKIARNTLDVFINQKSPGIVLEMCYHPVIETQLFHNFLNAGWKVISGVEAMIYQGIAQQVLWTGIPIDKIPTKKIKEQVYSSINN